VFIGHAALALAAKTRARSVSLGWLFAATFGLDLLWPIFLLIGVERVRIVPGDTAFTPLAFDAYPWSHSLLMAIVWGVLAAALARWKGITRASAVLVGALVVSHWLLDYVSHRPDLPLWPGNSPRVGLGLWNSIPATLIVEGSLYLAGVVLYVRATRPLDRIGVWGLWSLLTLCLTTWAAGPFGSPPPSARALAWFAMGLWLLVLWAGWADAHRGPRPIRSQAS
jgi:membrane-bound metal-dependent hydrolase YbcI (DUF457 family)